MDEGVRQRITLFAELQEKHSESYFKFMRYITLISTGLLSLLVSLKPHNIQKGAPQILFLTTISLLGAGILFSALTQFYEVAYAKQKMKAHRQMLSEYIRDKAANKYQHKDLPKHIIFSISEKLTFLCLSLSIVALIGYVFSLELCL